MCTGSLSGPIIDRGYSGRRQMTGGSSSSSRLGMYHLLVAIRVFRLDLLKPSDHFGACDE